ncbi:MAG: SAM-dependent methyltransferase [Ignavibacteriales bacterium]|nr:MAG: SAM-dependent methyltransferase [Ignavibacteriales bacterium]
MKLKYVLPVLNILKIEGLSSIMKDWRSFIRLHFIYSAYESGLLKELTVPCSKETLIEKLKVKRSETLDALLQVGLAVKELKYENGLFSLRGKRSKAIIGVNGDLLAAVIQANITYYSDAYRNISERICGAELGDDLNKIGDVVARVSKITEPVIRQFILNIVRNKKSNRMLDIGCGSGILLKSTFESNPNTTGVGLDIDKEVVRQAIENISGWGLSDRFRILQGDIREIGNQLNDSFDLITMNNLLYYFREEERVDLLKTLQMKLNSSGVLALAMSFNSRGKDLGSANLNLVNCSLKGLTPLPELEETELLLKDCGFKKIESHQFLPGSTFYGIIAHNE